MERSNTNFVGRSLSRAHKSQQKLTNDNDRYRYPEILEQKQKKLLKIQNLNIDTLGIELENQMK